MLLLLALLVDLAYVPKYQDILPYPLVILQFGISGLRDESVGHGHPELALKQDILCVVDPPVLECLLLLVFLSGDPYLELIRLCVDAVGHFLPDIGRVFGRVFGQSPWVHVDIAPVEM